ncbi:unannotated protein [freshwater metagenome]|uniref:Unannotated protein n=2 Tax=freshwater metagenome TaxID=449393 RepID=A0A6J7MYL2_9ZZZZ|nr:aldehyde dehydrogenase family protein [Actinomycetota bacterium]
MTQLLNLINGEFRAPASGTWSARGRTPDGRGELEPGPDSSAADVEDAMQAALAARSSWASLSPFSRADVLRSLAAHLRAASSEYALSICHEVGKPIAEAAGEIENAARVLEFYAGLAHEIGGDHFPSRQAGVHMFTRREPRGVVGVITPWNFPVNLAIVKLAPALLAGNVVVWKPAEQASTSSELLARGLVASGVPAGVVNMVLGDGPNVGAAVTALDLDGVSFTGSCTVGQQIESDCAARGIKCLTELGGKNVAVVCGDADLNAATEAIINGAFRFAGQKCTATSRVVVEEAVHDELVQRLRTRTVELVLGVPDDSATFLGPMISEAAVADVLEHITIARSMGAELVVGGERGVVADAPNGAFLQPTILTGVTAGMRIATDELFAPVVVVIRASSVEDAFDAADATDFGLTAAIFTTDLGTAFRFVERAEVGAVQVNLPTAGLEYQSPVGGRRNSGSGGLEQGAAALDFYTRSKAVSIRFATDA